jgi:hypothetical protein
VNALQSSVIYKLHNLRSNGLDFYIKFLIYKQIKIQLKIWITLSWSDFTDAVTTCNHTTPSKSLKIKAVKSNYLD